MRRYHIYVPAKRAAAALCALAMCFGRPPAGAAAAAAANVVATAGATVASASSTAVVAAAGAAVVATATTGAPGRTTERALNNYVGSRDYLDVLFNIDFQDIGGSWARDAIYESGALGIVKGFGAPLYYGSVVMTKGEALALAVRAAGLEGEAQAAGEAIEAAERLAGRAASGAEAVWINGALRVAADMGLISALEYEAATGSAQAQALSPFRSGAVAQRQEFAYWLARALDIPPVRGQESVFTNYSDWQSVDSLYVPYVEAVLRERIMSGDALGRFMPRDGLTREQAAQVIKNASKFVFAKNGFVESTGTIERIETDVAAAPEGAGAELMRANYYIRNQIGRLDVITTEIAVGDSAGAASAGRRETGLVVNAGGLLEDETVLKTGDRVRYISSRNRYPGRRDEIRYMEILPGAAGGAGGGAGVAARAYVLAQIDGIDHVNRRIAFTQIFPLEYPDANSLYRAAEAPQELLRLSAEYIYSEVVAVRSNGAHVDIGALQTGMVVIIGVEDFRSLFYIETVMLSYHLGEPGVARGIIEENNPVLGYVSMYSESGDRTAVRSLGREGERPELMIYNYSDAMAVDVMKDGVAASLDALSAGDSAFVRFDGSGELTAISAVTNYKERYGTVISVLADSLVIRFDEDASGYTSGSASGNPPGKASGGASEAAFSLPLGADVMYFKDYRLAGKSALVPGASVRVLLQDLAGVTVVREVTIMHEGDRGRVGNVYKAVLSRFDEMSKKAVVYNVQKLVKGRWEWADRKGFDAVNIDAETRIYMGNTLVTPAGANKLLRDNEVYIAVMNDYGGVEVAAQISVRGADDKEQLYDGAIRSIRRSTGVFSLANGPGDIALGDFSIIIKDGLLISGAAVEQDDLAYVVASREDATGRMRAEVVEIGGRADNTRVRIYRGRISNVVLHKEFTLESFSELELGGTEWKYANTPKTFSLTFDTLFLTSGGATQLNMFDGRGQYDYTDPPRTVYVLSDGTDALAISTAPYGIENIRGTVVSVDGVELDEDGAAMSEPDGMTIGWVSYYDRAKFSWTQRKGDTAVVIAPNTLIIKNSMPVAPSAIRKSDAVRVIKSDTAVSGTGYIIIIEN
ncbi:MAG: S-layer homology domain-containing protein [Oscillospiraceae bacterium]|nr:S-layer homology domain-containing protein [Oscillospiraceae bacterium]